ncbi:uncharacterized protein LOC131164986 [Malania oleifera]|uniref:uncharacterized protein LOC131164986 n=1 Tax=Malania oleifera TaxID=397392 RepID=UPI0025ADFA6E|nr:uncharacterized protein LOC131164986 [Malania oleifera]XP_057978546.1 uncharacterized protein LOC131164986 [Malania oleifera]XP_057978547.1 uncharacterized protein LOC131164986 [Malania oleifera]XP_057978548.1 uncharacterized protein LOC131164986 [Malania oleifera]
MVTTEGGGGGDETTSSPKGRVKFLCSHGGKILPRPVDGHLKYVGGDTRVVAVSRDITFSELMRKLTSLFDGEMVLKYQIIPEDLDALVSVRSDEDLRHMLDEYDRQESGGTPRLRAFLFPSKSVVIESQTSSVERQALEQRFIDAVNGIVRTPSSVKRISVNTNRPSFTISSACSSPKSLSPDGPSADPMNHELPFSSGLQNSRMQMHRVRSSPTLCSLSNNQHYQHSLGNHTAHQHHHHYFQNPRLHHQQHSHQASRPPDPHKGGVGERLIPAPLMGRQDMGRSQMGHAPTLYYSSAGRHHQGSGCNNCGQYDCSPYRCARVDRADSLPHSPVEGYLGTINTLK